MTGYFHHASSICYVGIISTRWWGKKTFPRFVLEKKKGRKKKGTRHLFHVCSETKRCSRYCKCTWFTPDVDSCTSCGHWVKGSCWHHPNHITTSAYLFSTTKGNKGDAQPSTPAVGLTSCILLSCSCETGSVILPLIPYHHLVKDAF